MPRDCKHGQLARVCNICEMEAEITRLRAVLAWENGTDCNCSGCDTRRAALAGDWNAVRAAGVVLPEDA